MYSFDEFGYSLLPDDAFRKEGGRMRLWGGKGSAPAIPDPNPGLFASAQATIEVGKMQERLAQEYLNFSKGQYEDFAPFLQGLAKTELDIALDNKARADEYADYERETFRPLERQLIADVGRYSTAENRELLAQEAKADVATAYDVQKQQLARELGRFGINPNSGRFAAINAGLSMDQAAQESGAMTKTRRQAEGLGYARMQDAVSMGRGLPSNASTAYGIAVTAGDSAGRNALAPSQAMGESYGRASGIYGGASQAFGAAGNIYGNEYGNRVSAYNARLNYMSNQGNFLGSVLGTGLGLAGSYAIGKFADGGPAHDGAGKVAGPGGPIDDKVPAMLSDGEYVIPADVVEKKGIKFFDDMVKKHHTPAAEQRKRGIRGKK